MTIAHIRTITLQGVDVLPIDVQAKLSNIGSTPKFKIVGLPDKAVAESSERVRSALEAIGLSMPICSITINLAPADVQKEGSHFDLPIAVGLLVVMGVLPAEEIANYVVMGELGLDGSIRPVQGVLPSAFYAAQQEMGIICPAACGAEAVWAGEMEVLAPASLIMLVNHFKGTQLLTRPAPKVTEAAAAPYDLFYIKGQETAKRALEIAAAGGHNLLVSGSPGSGKSMLARCLPGLLPPLSPQEALEVTMVYSVAGLLAQGGLIRQRPFRDPHHSASLPALVGGGIQARPGEISLAHLGVLFLDELPEFSRVTLESLRQPLEGGYVVVSRANATYKYPAQFQLIAAMNPCRCGYVEEIERGCGRAPKCAKEYQSKLSGPLLDRIDLMVEVPPVTVRDLSLPMANETTAAVAERVKDARQIQQQRFSQCDKIATTGINAHLQGKLLEEFAMPDSEGQVLLNHAAEKLKLSARSYHRILRVARTIADLSNSFQVQRPHVAEALTYRRIE